MSKVLLACLAVVIILGGGQIIYLNQNKTTVPTPIITRKTPKSTTLPVSTPTQLAATNKPAPAIAATPVTPAPSNALITSSPVDLSQIRSMSKFRSCAGHDFSGFGIDNVAETNRSMKHYFLPISSLDGSLGQVKEIAPFDGTVVVLFPESSQHGNQMWIQSSADPTWIALLFHLDTKLPIGTAVKSGDLMGYANLGSKDYSFDVALMKMDSATLTQMKGYLNPSKQDRERERSSGEKKPTESPKFTYDSFLAHMTPDLISTYAARGITTTKGIISKDARDSRPCVFGGPMTQADWVLLTQ